MATREDLIAQVENISDVYSKLYGKQLPEIYGSPYGSITGLNTDVLEKMIQQYGAGATMAKNMWTEAAKKDATKILNLRGLEANEQAINKVISGQWKNGLGMTPAQYRQPGWAVDKIGDQMKKLFENTGVGVQEGTADPITGQPVVAPQNNVPATTDISNLLNQAYAPQEEDLYRQIMSLASKRGGLDTGGLATSYSKGLANIKAAKAGATIDWNKFLKGLELPTAEFNWTKDYQNKQFNFGVNKYQDTMNAMRDYYGSQQKSNWWDPVVQSGATGILTKLIGLV